MHNIYTVSILLYAVYTHISKRTFVLNQYVNSVHIHGIILEVTHTCEKSIVF